MNYVSQNCISKRKENIQKKKKRHLLLLVCIANMEVAQTTNIVMPITTAKLEKNKKKLTKLKKQINITSAVKCVIHLA